MCIMHVLWIDVEFCFEILCAMHNDFREVDVFIRNKGKHLKNKDGISLCDVVINSENMKLNE